MRDRALNMNVRITEEERAKLHALAEDRDLSASTLVRHMVREAYAQRFGAAPPPLVATETAPTARKGRR
jgi:hypothetical protein